jgi:hypothetical protein
MGKRTLTMLVALTAVVVIAGALAWQRREDAVAATGEAAQVFPGLAAEVNDVSRVVVHSADGEVVLARDGEAWSVESKGGYPAAVEPIRKALIGLVELRTVEAKTADPARWSKLGVEDVADEGSTSKEIEVSAGGRTVAALVVGKPRAGSGALDELYVRKPGENQTWLVAGELVLPTAPSGWLDRTITKIPRDRVRGVTFARPDGETLRVERESTEQKNWTVVDLGERELRNATIANSLGNGLEFLELSDVRPADEVDFESDWLADATFECWNGLVVVARTKDVDGTAWARFEASYDASVVRDPSPVPPGEGDAATVAEAPAAAVQDEAEAEAVRAEAAALNTALGPWAYALPQYNRTALTKRMQDLVKEPVLGTDETPVVIPSTLPQSVQDEIKAHQESLGNKWVVKDPEPGAESGFDIQDVTTGAEDGTGDGMGDAPATPPEDGGGG